MFAEFPTSEHPEPFDHLRAEQFSEQLLLGTALQEVNVHGYSFISAALNESFREQLLTEVQAVPWERMADTYKAARQGADQHIIHAPFAGYPAVAELAHALEHRVQATSWGLRGLECYRPNEASLLRYRPDDLGITPHYDERRYHHLVAIFTLTGRADFGIVRDRAATDVVAAWEQTPGSLALLRAPGFNGITDGRPLHVVGGGKGEDRIAVVYRMNSQLGARFQGH